MSAIQIVWEPEELWEKKHEPYYSIIEGTRKGYFRWYNILSFANIDNKKTYYQKSFKKEISAYQWKGAWKVEETFTFASSYSKEKLLNDENHPIEMLKMAIYYSIYEKSISMLNELKNINNKDKESLIKIIRSTDQDLILPDDPEWDSVSASLHALTIKDMII